MYGALQDFHLAKRHYDLAYEANAEAYLPVLMSLIKLHVRSVWHTLMGGKNGLTLWDGEEESSKSQQSFSSLLPHTASIHNLIPTRSLVLRQP